MFDIPVRRLIDPPLEQVARKLVGLRIQANTITWVGFAIGLIGAVLVSQQWYVAALLCVMLNRLCDGLDGCVARLTSKTDAGGFLDIALDMVFYSSVPFAFAVASPANALPAAFVLFSFLGTGTSFLAYAVIAAKRGIVADKAAKKSFFHSTGLIEGTETVVFLVLICLFPHQFVWMAWVMGGLCCLTTTVRIATSTWEFSEQS